MSDEDGTTTQVTEGDEQRKVECWRLHVLIEAGYPVDLAEEIAQSDADLHCAVDLVKNGCRYQTAASIVL